MDALKVPGNSPNGTPGNAAGGSISISGGSPLIQMFGQKDPFEDMARMREMVDRMFGMDAADPFGWSAPVLGGKGFGRHMLEPGDASFDKDGNYVVKLELPGYDKSEIKATVNDDTLVISAKKNASAKNMSKNSMVRSFDGRQFQSMHMLPGPADHRKMKVDYENGILTVTVPMA